MTHTLLASFFLCILSLSSSAFAEGKDMELRYAEEELAKAEANYYEQLKKIKDPKPQDVDRLRKEILEPKQEALRKVMGQESKPNTSQSDDPRPKTLSTQSADSQTLDGSKIEKTIQYPGKKKPGSDIRKPTPKAITFKEESAQGNYQSEQIQFQPKKKK